MAALWSGGAFVSATTRSRSWEDSLRVQPQHLQPGATASPPRAGAVALASGALAARHSLGPAALLCALAVLAAAPLRKRRSRNRACQAGRCAVHCRAAAGPWLGGHRMPPVALGMTATPTASKMRLSLLDVPVQKLPSLLDLSIAASTPTPPPPLSNLQEAGLQWARPQHTVSSAYAPVAFDQPGSPSRKRCGMPARLVGGARKVQARRALRAGPPGRGSAGARAARRSAGARLSPAAAEPRQRVLAPAFDASRLRTSIQDGLRTASRIRSERGREAKGSAPSTGLCEAAEVLFMSTHLSINDFSKY